MKGVHRVQVQNKRVRYDFELRRNLTILRGDSATGKTTLVDMIREKTNSGDDSSIQLACDKKCNVLEGATWRGQLSEMQDSIVFVDEGNAFVLTDEFSQAIQKTDNYYVIVSREGLENLPYSLTEIYGIRTSGKYGSLKQQYNEFYRIYGENYKNEVFSPDTVITEDSNAGYQFFESACVESGKKCFSSNGKSGMLAKAKACDKDDWILLIVDGAAFGSEMDRTMKFLKGHNNVRLYAPESFEWLILKANPMKNALVQEMLETPSDYIESKEFFSWERYFTRILIESTHGTWLQYAKSKINPSYLKGAVKDAILEVMANIRFDRG